MTPTSIVPVQDDRERLDLIRRTICKNELTDDEFELFVAVAKAKGLDPLQNQIYAVKRWSAAQQREVMTIQTGIDGYRLIAHRHGLAGIDDAVHVGKVRISGPVSWAPEKVTITVYRRANDGSRDPYTATARWSEYYPGDGKPGAMWRRRPAGQLEKCAEALALRRGFQELAGLYTDDEMHQADREPPAEAVRQSQREPEEIEGAVVGETSVHKPSEASDDQVEKIRALKQILGIGWSDLCRVVLSRELTGRPSRDEAAQLLAWMRDELAAREEPHDEDTAPMMDGPR